MDCPTPRAVCSPERREVRSHREKLWKTHSYHIFPVCLFLKTQNDANTFHLSTPRIHGSLRLYGVSTGCLWRWDLLFNLCSPEIWTFKTSALKQSTASAMFLWRLQQVAQSHGKTMPSSKLCFRRLCFFFVDPLSWTGLFLWLKPREISGARDQSEVLITTRKADLLAAEVLRLGEITDAEAKQLLGLEGFRQHPRNIPQISSNIINIYQNHQISLATFGIYCTSPSGRSIPFDRQPNSWYLLIQWFGDRRPVFSTCTFEWFGTQCSSVTKSENPE